MDFLVTSTEKYSKNGGQAEKSDYNPQRDISRTRLCKRNVIQYEDHIDYLYPFQQGLFVSRSYMI